MIIVICMAHCCSPDVVTENFHVYCYLNCSLLSPDVIMDGFHDHYLFLLIVTSVVVTGYFHDYCYFYYSLLCIRTLENVSCVYKRS